MKKFLGILFIVLAGIMTFFGIVALVPARSCSVARADSLEFDDTSVSYTADLPVPGFVNFYNVVYPVSDFHISLTLVGDVTSTTWDSYYLSLNDSVLPFNTTDSFWLDYYDSDDVSDSALGLLTVPPSSVLTSSFTEFTVFYEFISGSPDSVVNYYLRFYDIPHEQYDFVLLLSLTYPAEIYSDGNSFDDSFPLVDLQELASAYDNAYAAGYSVGINTSLSTATPWNLLVQQVNRFLDLPIFGTTVRFSTIISIGIGMLFLGIGLKFFLGG